MEALTGPVEIVCALLALAGGFKTARPATTAGALRAMRLPSRLWMVRALGVGEIVLGVVAGVTLSPAWLVLTAAVYFGFAAFVVAALQAHAPVQSCGCFGQVDTPPSAFHVVLNLAAAATLLAAAVTDTPAPSRTLSDQPWSGVPFALLVAVCVYLCVVILTVLPMTLGSRHRA